MKMQRLNAILLAVIAVMILVQLAMVFASPVSAIDAKVGSDSATISVTTSADGMHVYVCDGHRCYASHDGAKTFMRLKVD